MNVSLPSLKEHLLSRSCDPSLYHVHLDENARVATFLLFSLSGALAGYQTYRPEGVKNTSEGRKLGLTPRELKYFTYVSRDKEKNHFTVPTFGMDRYDWKKRTVYVTEGIFDAVKLHNLGLNAVAALCNNPKPLRSFFNALGTKVVGVLDNDQAGMQLAKVCDDYVLCPPGRDPGDMSLDELKELLKL